MNEFKHMAKFKMPYEREPYPYVWRTVKNPSAEPKRYRYAFFATVLVFPHLVPSTQFGGECAGVDKQQARADAYCQLRERFPTTGVVAITVYGEGQPI